MNIKVFQPYIVWYSIIFLIGIVIWGAGLEAHLLIDYLKRTDPQPDYSLSILNFERPYSAEIHAYYVGYHTYNERNTDNIPYNAWRGFRGTVVYVSGIGGLALWYLLMIPSLWMMGNLAYGGEKLKQSRRKIRAYFWAGLALALTIPIFMPAMTFITIVTE